jgi:antitoxin FitA
MSTHSLTIRNIPAETFLGVKAYAKAQGKSVEAFLRTVLDQTVRPPERIKLGALLQSHGNAVGDLELADLRDKTPYTPIVFED